VYVNRRNNEERAQIIPSDDTELVPLKCGKLATEYPWIYGYFFTVYGTELSRGRNWCRGWCRWRKAATTAGRGNCAWVDEQSDTVRPASSRAPDKSPRNDSTGLPIVRTPSTRERCHALSRTSYASSGPFRLWDTAKDIRTSAEIFILRRVFSHILNGTGSLVRRFTDTNVYETGSVKIWKTRQKLSVDARIFLQCTWRC